MGWPVKRNRFALAIALLAPLALALSGCIPLTSEATCENGEPVPPVEAPSVGVAVVFQSGEGFPDASTALAQDALLKQSFPESENQTPTAITMIVADGNPNQVFKSWVSLGEGEIELDLKQKNDRLQGKIRSVYECEFSQNADNERLQPLTDVLGAMDLAASGLSEVDGAKKIFVFSNGLQTSGQLDFSEEFPSTPEGVESIVSALEEANALPNLEGAQIYWTGMGVTSDSLDALNQQSKNMLELFWTRLILASNGLPPEQYSAGSLGNSSLPFASSDKQSKSIENVCLFTLGEASGFTFKPDSSEFLDRASATQGALGIAREIIDSECNVGVRVTGFTASGTSRDRYKPESDFALSKARAEAFAELLEANDIKVSEVLGGGKGPIEDWDNQGRFVEELGKLNRIVRVEAID